MALFDLLNNVKDMISRHNDPNQPQYPQDNLMGAVEGLFQQHAANQGDRSVRPASDDPYGDPAGNVQPASQDPYGDPADGDVRPASQDPYGDPADQ
jgi:hypothetical protein